MADEIKRRYPGLHIFFPEKDSGVDLIVLGDLSKESRYPLTIQVKESRYFGTIHSWDGGHSWHRIDRNKLEDAIDEIDFYVFLTYVNVPKDNKTHFKNEFIIVQPKEILRLCQGKMSQVYDLYFAFEYDEHFNQVIDVREMRGRKWTRAEWEKAPSYLPYCNNWDQLVDTLEDHEDIRGGLLGLSDEEGSISWEEYKERRAQGK